MLRVELVSSSNQVLHSTGRGLNRRATAIDSIGTREVKVETCNLAVPVSSINVFVCAIGVVRYSCRSILRAGAIGVASDSSRNIGQSSFTIRPGKSSPPTVLVHLDPALR